MIDVIDPIPLPGSALTEVACDAGPWSCVTDTTLGVLGFSSVVWFIKGVAGTFGCGSWTSGVIGCATGNGKTGNGEQITGDEGNSVL